MSFWERYEKLCMDAGYKPISEQAAQVIGIKRQNISTWKKSGNPPTYGALIKIADAYGVSTDFLLERTDDPTDYSNPGLNLDKNAKKTVALQRAPAGSMGSGATPKGITLYAQLDDSDKNKVEGFMQGLLAQDKYSAQLNSRKKRA